MLPKNRKCVKSKFIFKVKRDHLGRIKKYKARLVAKGFTQKKGIDFNETYSPVAKGVSFRLALALALQNESRIAQLDVETAFPYADLEEEVYMSAPDGLELPQGYCLKLTKSLYGLKQAPRNWNEHLKTSILGLGYQQSALDNCIYFRRDGDQLHIILIYVDDIIVVSSSAEEIQSVVESFKKEYAMQDLGDLKHYLGITIERQEKGFKVHQKAYAEAVIDRFKHLLPKSGRRVKTPLPPGVKLTKASKATETEKQREYAEAFPYQPVVGALMYLAVNTRIDMAFAVNQLSRFNSCPTYEACRAAVHTLRYLNETQDYGLIFPNHSKEGLVAYSDADWAGDMDTSRSTTGYVVYLWGAPIAWQSRLQPTVASSTTESEYMAAYAAIQEIVWIRGVMSELGLA